MAKLVYPGHRLPVSTVEKGYIPKGKSKFRIVKNDDLFSFLQEIGKKVDSLILELFSLYNDKKTSELVDYQINVGGKRLRPALAVLICLAFGGKLDDVLYPAAGLEIIHNYSLMIDDIIDGSLLRRGRSTVWAKFGNSMANCVGVHYTASVFQASNRSKYPVKISEIFAKTMKNAVDGEILDLLFSQKNQKEEHHVSKNRFKEVSEKDYFEMVKKKTATVLEACCEVGGICADAKEEQIKHLKNIGQKLGIAGQIKDDILDIFGKEGKSGKDIKEGKLGNIVIVLALKELSPRDKEKFLTILSKEGVGNQEIEEAIDLIKKTNSHQKSLELAKRFSEDAKKELSFLPQNKWNESLKQFADYIATIEK